MKIPSTLFLKAAILLMGTGVLALCVFVLPRGIATTAVNGYRPILIGMYVTAVPFFIALYQGWKLLRAIDAHNAFSAESARALKNIAYCGGVIGLIYGAGLPYIYHVAKMDDAPGVMALGCIIVFVSFVIAIFAALLQKLLEEAIRIKTENELTV